MSHSNRRNKKKSSSKRRKLKSYQEYYETSMNNLIEDFETNLDISPILPNKTISKTQYTEQKETETIPEFSLDTTNETNNETTDDIPRIQELQHHDFYGIPKIY